MNRKLIPIPAIAFVLLAVGGFNVEALAQGNAVGVSKYGRSDSIQKEPGAAIVLQRISEFAEKLGLQVPTPIHTNAVAKFLSYRDEGEIKAAITLTNGMEFSFDRGCVVGFRAARSYFSDPPASAVKKYFGGTRLNKDQAIAAARKFIGRLGFDERNLFVDLEPQVDMPEKYRDGVIPRYGVEWIDPRTGILSVQVEVDGERGTVEQLEIINTSVLKAKKPSVDLINWSQTNKSIGSIIGDIEGFCAKLKLVIVPALTLTQITNVSTFGGGGHLTSVLWFSNGYIFYYKDNARLVMGFEAPDAFYTTGRKIRAADFQGDWNVTQDDAVILVKQSIQRLGYSERSLYLDRTPNIGKPSLIGKRNIPRFRVHWDDNETGTITSAVTCEVDAMKGSVKSIFIMTGLKPGEPNILNGEHFEGPTNKAIKVIPNEEILPNRPNAEK